VELFRSVFLALLVSLAVHVLLAVGLVSYLEYAPTPDVVATLDLTSVELSFAEKVEDSAAVAPVPPAPPPEPPKPESDDKPPEQKIEKLAAPDPLAPKFPEPKEEMPEIKAPDVPKPSERSKQPEPPKPAPPAVSAAPRQARIDAPPSPKRTIRPDYPKGARQRGEQGEVTLEIRVDAEGDVSEAKVVVGSGFAELDEAAVRAVQKAKFRPAKSGDRGVASTARLKLEFKLK